MNCKLKTIYPSLQTSGSCGKCISAKAIGNDKILEMIASYLPDLLNEQYISILN